MYNEWPLKIFFYVTLIPPNVSGFSLVLTMIPALASERLLAVRYTPSPSHHAYLTSAINAFPKIGISIKYISYELWLKRQEPFVPDDITKV